MNQAPQLFNGGGYGNGVVLPPGGGNAGILQMLQSLLAQKIGPTLMGANKFPIQKNQDTIGHIDAQGNYTPGIF